MCALVTVVQTCALPISGVEGTEGESRPAYRGGAISGGFRRTVQIARLSLHPVRDRHILLHGIWRARLHRIAAHAAVRYGSADRWSDLWKHRSVRSDLRQPARRIRSEEHTSELQSLMRISYAVFCLKKKTHTTTQ